jgi:hypothetical protein
VPAPATAPEPVNESSENQSPVSLAG